MGPAMGQGYGTAVPAGQPLVGRITVGLQHPGKAVVCVKFSNLIVVLGDASGEPPVSVAAVTARWVDCLQLLEVELGNGLELLRQPRPLRDWPAGCPAKRGIRPASRSAPLPPPPSAWAAVGCVAPAARPACGCPGGAGHGVAPGVRLGSLVRCRYDVWACSQSSGQA